MTSYFGLGGHGVARHSLLHVQQRP